MRIAQIAPVSERIPPKKYGGTERVVYALTEQLVKRGHDVTLFASGDSITSAKLVSVVPKSLRELKVKNPYGLNEPTFLNIGLAYQNQHKFDVIHDHNYLISLPTANLAKTPVVMTVHGQFNEDNVPVFKLHKNVNYVSISKAQIELSRGLPIAGTVYNGLDMSNFPFSEEDEGYLLFVGRMNPEKGVHHAVEVAEKTGIPLVIAARVSGELEESYFNQYIKPKLFNGNIVFVGEVGERERNKLMSKALAVLHPITWPEPFGYTLIEAMACGAPIIGIGLGSIPEIVAHGKSGYVAKNVNEMVKYVYKIDKIKRINCRQRALEFSDERMADGYEAIYQHVMEQARSRSVSELQPQGLLLNRNNKKYDFSQKYRAN